jgi:hypothetical protein
MLKFAAEDFWEASQMLAQWQAKKLDFRSKGAAANASTTLTKLLGHLRELKLPVSVREFEKLSTRINDSIAHAASLTEGSQHQAYAEIDEDINNSLRQLSSIIHSELESRAFFYIPQDRHPYYDQKELFGTEVNLKFPSIQYDMVEAGNCYAMGRGTACIFHLMRIMEVGVQQFGTKLGVSIANEKNWQNILDEINKAIKALPARDPATVEMSQASGNLYSVKLAWRNEVMHPNDTYTLEEAEDLIRQVKLFIGQLAAII